MRLVETTPVLYLVRVSEHAVHNQKDHAGKGRSVAPADQTPEEQAAVAAWSGKAHVAPNGQTIIVDFHNRIQDALAFKRREPDVPRERWELARQQGETLMQMAADAPPTTEPLYRGLATDAAGYNRWAERSPGDTVTLTLASYSQSESVARQFASGELLPNRGYGTMPVMLKIEPGARALDINQARGAYEGSWEQESVTAGTFKVTGVSNDPTGLSLLTVTMQQTAPARTAKEVRFGESVLREHLGGKHDQKLHGRKGGVRPQSERLKEQLAQVDADLRTIRGAERIVAIDPATGKVTLDKGNDGTAVALTLADDIAMRGTIATHNHPLGWNDAPGSLGHNGSGPSVDDLLTAQRAGVADMRIVTPTQTFSVKPGTDATWGKQTDMAEAASKMGLNYDRSVLEMNVRQMERDSYNRIATIENSVRSDFMGGINSGLMTPAQAQAMHHEEVLRRSSQEFGWEYSVERHAGYVDPATSTGGDPWMPPSSTMTLGQGVHTPAGTASFSLGEAIAEILERVRLLEHPGHGSQKVHGRRGGVSIAGTQLANISEKTRGKLEARRQKLGMPSVGEMADKLSDTYDGASDEAKESGGRWYEDAHNAAQFAGEASGYGLEKASAVMALNSPSRHWDANKAVAAELMGIMSKDKPFKPIAGEPKKGPLDPNREYRPSELTPAQLAYAHPDLRIGALNQKYALEGKATRGYGKNHYQQIETSVSVLRGDLTPDQALTGVKVRNFYNNIYDPRSGSGVTLDDWAYKAALGDMPVNVRYDYQLSSGERVRRTYIGPADNAPYGTLGTMVQSSPVVTGENYKAGLYPLVAEAYSIAAARAGITPSQLQAIVWVETRGSE